MNRAIFMLVLVLSAISVGAAQRRKSIFPSLTFDVAAVNNAAGGAELKLWAKGSAVLRAQILLDRAHYSVGEIDGAFGEAMESAVKAYQSAHSLQCDGVISPEMWQALNVDTAPALVLYTITPQDILGPFKRIPKKMEAQGTLPFLGYESPEEEFGERFHVSPRVLKALNTSKDLVHSGEQITVPNVQRAPLVEQASLVVVRQSCSCLDVLDAQHRTIAHYPATMGSTHDPLPIGDWKIGKPLINPVFHYNPKLFWDAKPKNPKSRISPGPNNPAGLVWVSLSKEHYGIHGTPTPSQVGKRESHGCIRLTNWDVSELAQLVRPGMIARLLAK